MWQKNADKKDTAKLLDGVYLLNTDRKDLGGAGAAGEVRAGALVEF
jgi:hypothetical protein